jgi:hypothetical protein
MAGLAAYDDLTGHLLGGGPVTPRAWLKNVRCKSDDGDPPLWASRTAAAVETAESLADRPRIFNLALSDPTHTTAERTSWSTALDQLAHNDERGRLICVAIGNATQFANPADYPAHNMASYLHDPRPGHQRDRRRGDHSPRRTVRRRRARSPHSGGAG